MLNKLPHLRIKACHKLRYEAILFLWAHKNLDADDTKTIMEVHPVSAPVDSSGQSTWFNVRIREVLNFACSAAWLNIEELPYYDIMHVLLVVTMKQGADYI
jgi:hypothetical protein